jgi:hypothetical protein
VAFIGKLKSKFLATTIGSTGDSNDFQDNANSMLPSACEICPNELLELWEQIMRFAKVVERMMK